MFLKVLDKGEHFMNKDNTKKRIMDAFWDLYSEKKIEKISVKEVALKANCNRSTFYEYFLDIYDVLDQIEATLIPNINELPPIKIDNQHLGMPTDMFLKLFEQKEKYYSVLLGENGDPAFSRKLKDSIKPVILNTISEEKKKNIENLDFIIEYTLSAMNGVMQYWLENQSSMSPEKLVKLTGELMDKGVSSYLY